MVKRTGVVMKGCLIRRVGLHGFVNGDQYVMQYLLPLHHLFTVTVLIFLNRKENFIITGLKVKLTMLWEIMNRIEAMYAGLATTRQQNLITEACMGRILMTMDGHRKNRVMYCTERL